MQLCLGKDHNLSGRKAENKFLRPKKFDPLKAMLDKFDTPSPKVDTKKLTLP